MKDDHIQANCWLALEFCGQKKVGHSGSRITLGTRAAIHGEVPMGSGYSRHEDVSLSPGKSRLHSPVQEDCAGQALRFFQGWDTGFGGAQKLPRSGMSKLT
jgi:hypothetical protein